jgi:hypothetical protein
VFQWVQPHLREDQVEPLEQLLDRARVNAKPASSPSTLTELQPAGGQEQQRAEGRSSTAGGSPVGLMMIVTLVAVLMMAGYLRGRRAYSDQS